MGGYGSGRWGCRYSKLRVEQCLVLDAARWTREGILREGVVRSGGGPFGVGYRIDTTDITCPLAYLTYDLAGSGHFDYPVLLQTTRPQFGGLRWWFTCPLCWRRVQKLFLPPRRSHFSCRCCHNLSYASRSYGALDRSRERARKIRLRLGGSASLLDAFPLKPKGMWSRTYQRLRDRSERHQMVHWHQLMEKYQ